MFAVMCVWQVEVQMFQLYKDKLEDLLWNVSRKSRGKESESPPNLRIVLADHSASGLVEVDVVVDHVM